MSDEKHDPDALARIQKAAKEDVLFVATGEVAKVPDWALEKVERALMKVYDGRDKRMAFVSDDSRVGVVMDEPEKLRAVGEMLGRPVTPEERIVDVAKWVAEQDESIDDLIAEAEAQVATEREALLKAGVTPAEIDAVERELEKYR